MLQLLLPPLKKAKEARVCIVGSVTGNRNTVAGSLVKPIADVGDLRGLKLGPGQARGMATLSPPLHPPPPHARPTQLLPRRRPAATAPPPRACLRLPTVR